MPESLLNVCVSEKIKESGEALHEALLYTAWPRDASGQVVDILASPNSRKRPRDHGAASPRLRIVSMLVTRGQGVDCQNWRLAAAGDGPRTIRTLKIMEAHVFSSSAASVPGHASASALGYGLRHRLAHLWISMFTVLTGTVRRHIVT